MTTVTISENRRKEDVIVKDSGMSWVMLFACFFISLLIYGVNRVNGVLFVAYRTLTNMSRESASWPFNISGVSAMVFAPLAGFLSTKLTSKTIAWTAAIMFAFGNVCCFFSLNVYFVCAFYGIIAGAGVIIWSNCIPKIINENFDVHRASAFGIAAAGAPIGSFMFPAFTLYCLEEFGLNGSFLVLGGISLNACVGVTLLGLRHQTPTTDTIEGKKNSIDESKESKPSTSTKENEEKNCALRSVEITSSKLSNLAIVLHILSKPHFYLIMLSQNVILNQTSIYNLVALDFAMDTGVSESDAVWILTLFSVGEVIGRMGFGWVTDKQLMSRQMFMGAQMIVAGLCYYLITLAQNFLMLATVSVVLGISLGTLLSVSTIIITDYIRIEALTWTISLIRTSGGIITLIRPPIIGHFRDNLGSYDGLFQIISGLAFFFGIMWMLDQIWIKITRRRGKVSTKTINDQVEQESKGAN